MKTFKNGARAVLSLLLLVVLSCEKRRKKVLTKGGVFGIVIKLSRAVELQRQRDEKSFEKAENKA